MRLLLQVRCVFRVLEWLVWGGSVMAIQGLHVDRALHVWMGRCTLEFILFLHALEAGACTPHPAATMIGAGATGAVIPPVIPSGGSEGGLPWEPVPP